MRPRLNGNGVWKGTHIAEAGKAFGGYLDGIIINPSGSRNKYGLPDNMKPEDKTKEVPLTPSQNRLLVSKGKKNISASHKPKGSLTEVSLNPSQFLGALNKAKQLSRTSKMNQAMADAGKTNGDPNLTKSDSQVTQVGDQAPIDPMTAMVPRKISKKIKKLNQKDVADYIPQLQLPDQKQSIPKKLQDEYVQEYAAAIPQVANIVTKAAPYIMTGVGALGTMMQAKRKYRTRLNPGKRNSGRVLSPAEKKIFDKSQKDTDQKVTDQKPRDKVVKKILDRNAEKQKERMKIPNRIQSDRRRLLRGMAKGEVMLDEYIPEKKKISGKALFPFKANVKIKNEIISDDGISTKNPVDKKLQDEYIPERKMTEKEKRKDDRLKKKYDKSDMKKSMQKQYGKEEGKKVYFATIRKQAMEEEMKKDHEPEMIRNQLKTAKRASKRIKSHTLKKDNFKAWVQSKITKASDYLDTAADYLDSKDDMKEGKDPKLTKIVKQLRKSVKSHGNQADYIEKVNKKKDVKEGAINPNRFSDAKIQTGGTIKKPTVIMPGGKELPGLGGGGGGTDAITGKAKTKTIGNTLKDVVKVGTIPARFLLNIKSKPDPTEKFADSNMTPKQKVSSAISNFKTGLGEESNPRIPRKKGQPANSKKHSDLYTDENPKGTIHGLGFKDVATAKASVSKIRKSNRSHAHKIQAAVAMEQRAREMGKTSEAAVYRKFINSMKKKTKK